jgi:hypothetical protein
MNKADMINQFNELIKKIKLDEIIDHCKNLNQRTLVIIAALALPVILLAVAVHSGASKNPPAAAARSNVPPHPTLAQARTTVRQRLAVLEKMRPEEWPQERKEHPWVAPTLQQAIQNNTARLAQLNAMNEAQYEAQFRPNGGNANANANAPKPQQGNALLNPQQRSALSIIPAPSQSQSVALPPTSR